MAIMHSITMPGGKNSEISYRVKCVAVENERLFGDVVVTQQTRNRLYWLNTCHYPDVSRKKLSNLTKQILETPDFMALNRKSINRKLNVKVTAILPISDNTSVPEVLRNGDVVDAVNRNVEIEKKQKSYTLPMPKGTTNPEVVVSSLVDQLLLDIYGYPRSDKGRSESDSTASSHKPPPQHRYLRRARLLRKCTGELTVVKETLREHVNHAGGLLVRQLRRRDYLLAKREKQYDVITAHLQAYSAKRSEDTRMRFSLTPQPGESGFTQWLDAMKMVARLQGGIPQEFRKRLWLTLAERHLEQRGVDWKQAEKLCFNEWSNPDDEELGIQIVKDLHRTGCSLFCGAAGRDNQAVLRRVLLGFARWNKSVGYCQGLNVLAAFILQVTDRAESSAVKVMIFLIEGVLPEGYFADNLRGLSIDMAVFRDLLRMRLPKLSRHLEALQCDTKDKATVGSSYEPPLTNVFTMQWFLTLFCHCLPEDAVLRVWDLIFLEGDEVLLRTALAIWEGISDRIMTVTSADEFYSIMGVLTREMLEFTDVNNLIRTIVNMGPLYGVTDLREKHRYNITPWARRLSDDEDTDTEEEEKLAVAAAMFGVSHRFKKDRSNAASNALQTIGPSNDRERLALDITTLKQQYAKLRERQRQAHIILSAACARQSMVPASTSQAMNHLLVGKSALVSVKTRQLGPPPGAIPPKPRTPVLHSPRVAGRRDKHAVTLHWKDTKKSKEMKNEEAVGDEDESTTSSVSTENEMSATLTSPKRGDANDSDSDSTSTELCDEPDRLSDVDSEEPTSTSDCYVMATDDEKSPRPGSSPIASRTPSRQSSEQQATSTKDTTILQVHQLTPDLMGSNDDHHEELLIVDEASSIAKITDQIKRLSASDTNRPSPTDFAETADDSKTVVEVDVQQKINEVARQNKTFIDVVSTSEDCFTRTTTSAPVEIDETSVSNYPVSEESFQALDSYDFSSDNKAFGTSANMQDDNDPLEEKYREIAEEDKKNLTNAAVSLEAKAHESVVRNSEDVESSYTELREVPVNDCVVGLLSTAADFSRIVDTNSHYNGTAVVSRFDSNLIKNNSWEKQELQSNELVGLECFKYENEEMQTTTPSSSDQSKTITGVSKLYSRSYVIGHLPIAPVTVSEKLTQATDMTSSKDSIKTLYKELCFDSDTVNDIRSTSVTATTGELETKSTPISQPAVTQGTDIPFELTLLSDNGEKLSQDIGDFDSSITNDININSPTGTKVSLPIKNIPTTAVIDDGNISLVTELSPLKNNVREMATYTDDVSKDINTSFNAATTIGITSIVTDSPSALSFSKLSSGYTKSINYELHNNSQSKLTSTEVAADIESPVTATVPTFTRKTRTEGNGDLDYRAVKNPSTNFECDPQIVSVDRFAGLLSLNGNTETFVDDVQKYDCDPKVNTMQSLSSQVSARKANTGDEEKNGSSISLIGINTGKSSSWLSPDYTYHNSYMTKIFEDKKKSPKTPESIKSFSSGETMGPDSKTSSLTTSPKTPNRPDSRMFAIDKSERSSVSSDSKTLTLRSLDSDGGANKSKLDTKSSITRPSWDKSSPSTPISSDSLKNKSEISPKFVISSSSESCSPGKVKSSERSFSSELQSPISANSIKYRTNYVVGQDNLSESSLDLCSATSPFYPIVNPNQNTPSPYSATEEQQNNTDSIETSPAQKSTGSQEDANSADLKASTRTDETKTLSDAEKSLKCKDDYDSARPFEKELADTLSTLPSEVLRSRSDRISSIYKDDPDMQRYQSDHLVEGYLEKQAQDQDIENDTISPLPGDKYENRLAFVDKVGSYKGIGVHGQDHKQLLGTKETLKPFERSCSSLENRYSVMKTSPSSADIGTNSHKKRSSDILEDLKRLESKTLDDKTADTSMLTRKTGYDWEDVKNLEARRLNNFSDSASGFSNLNIPSVSVFGETRKSYVVKPKINLEGATDSILESYSRKKSNGEPDDDRESKLGVWTKVKPRANRGNGRRSCDRALKIIQENSAILHKILTCQAKKRLPDLEEISKEITISPINEEISKIFSPILEKMGLNEHEINEELARINFQDFDQMTATGGSEFDAKINDELCKLSLIDDNEVIDHLDVDEVIARDYLDTREAFIDRQINEELSKLLANYEEASPICIVNRDETSSCQNPSELEGLELSNISSNVFSHQSSNDSIETKSELGSIQDAAIQLEKYPQYCENVMNFVQTPKYILPRGSSPRSDTDIYRELEKLDKISSGEIIPSSTIPQKIIPPISYMSECSLYGEVRPSSLEYSGKPEKSFDPSPMKSPYDTYKPYDFKSRISPQKTPINPYSARCYENTSTDDGFNFQDNPSTPSRRYDMGISRPILSKETLEFRVRYDEESSKQNRNDDLSLEPYKTDMLDLNHGASYYSEDSFTSSKRLSLDAECTQNTSVVSPLDYAYNQSELHTHKYNPLSLNKYSYLNTTSGHDEAIYNLDKDDEAGSYLPLRRNDPHSFSPNYQYADCHLASQLGPYNSEFSPSLENTSERPVSRPEFFENVHVAKYTEMSSRESMRIRKASMSLGLNESTTTRTIANIDTTASPRTLFSPFPVRNTSRKPKELGLKLGLYTPDSPGSTPLKRS